MDGFLSTDRPVRETRMVFSVLDHRGRVSPVFGDARLSFMNAPLVCTSIPVSRKKFLTFYASPYCRQTIRGRGSLHERRPMRPGQILLCQPVVTDHNSFSVYPSCKGGFTNRGLPTARPSILCPEIRPRRMRVCRMHLAPGLRQRITSYRLPLILNKKGYKYMLPAQAPFRYS